MQIQPVSRTPVTEANGFSVGDIVRKSYDDSELYTIQAIYRMCDPNRNNAPIGYRCIARNQTQYWHSVDISLDFITK